MTGTMEWQPPSGWRPFRRVLGAVLYLNARRSFRRMAEVLVRNAQSVEPGPRSD